MDYEQYVPWIISTVSILIALYFSSVSKRRDDKKDVEDDSTFNATIVAKLDSIRDNLQEIKIENRQFRTDISDLKERVAVAENSLKSFHKRLDSVTGRADDN